MLLTNKQKEEFQKLFEEKCKEIMIKGVSSGFKAAYNTMIQQIDNGMTPEEIKAWAQNENKLAEIVDKNI